MDDLAVYHLDISKQDYRGNIGYYFIHNCNYFSFHTCSLETPEYKILEADVANLCTFFYFCCIKLLFFWRAKKQWNKLDVLLLDNPLPYTFCNYW